MDYLSSYTMKSIESLPVSPVFCLVLTISVFAFRFPPIHSSLFITCVFVWYCHVELIVLRRSKISQGYTVMSTSLCFNVLALSWSLLQLLKRVQTPTEWKHNWQSASSSIGLLCPSIHSSSITYMHLPFSSLPPSLAPAVRRLYY